MGFFEIFNSNIITIAVVATLWFFHSKKRPSNVNSSAAVSGFNPVNLI